MLKIEMSLIMKDKCYDIRNVHGIKIVDENGSIAYTEQFDETTALMAIQDNGKTMKLFVNRTFQVEKTKISGDDTTLVLEHVNRVAVISPIVNFEKYNLYQAGCRVKILDGTIYVSPIVMA